jgi:membrane-associated protease RseP (regulator of RpoE activity)
MADGGPPPQPIFQRRLGLPLILFVLTCGSTFFAGATGWMPGELIFAGGTDLSSPYFQLPARLAVLEHWRDGLIYMGCVLSILLCHEMGHFVMTLLYGVRASLPLFVPFPVSPIGTMGAVIVMGGSQANRRQIFDIGLAGPVAGLVVAIPIIWIGASQLDLSVAAEGHEFGLPLAVRWLMAVLHPEAKDTQYIAVNQLNPFFMAGWVGMLITGLNMLPVSQLDGGHITYALFGRGAHWLARLFMLTVFAYMTVVATVYRTVPPWMPMALLVMLIGMDHPPTRDDTVPIGWLRTAFGLASLLIPVLCFAPNLVR